MQVNLRNGLVFFKHKAPIKGFNLALIACLIDRLMVLAAVETMQVGVSIILYPAGSMFQGLKADCSRQRCTQILLYVYQPRVSMLTGFPHS